MPPNSGQPEVVARRTCATAACRLASASRRSGRSPAFPDLRRNGARFTGHSVHIAPISSLTVIRLTLALVGGTGANISERLRKVRE